MPTVTIIQPTISEEQNHKLRCAAYCRVSSDSEDQLNSFMAQTRYYEKAFENSETELLVDIYADEGITGTREDKRDEFQRMISDCRKGKIDRIYTKSISRFARNAKDCLTNIRELKSLGITVLFEKENIDTADMTDEMMITIMGGLAQEESTSISQNLRLSIKKRMDNGTIKMCKAAFGYKLVNGELVLKEDEAEIVRKIFEWYLSGAGTTQIANKLNSMAVEKYGKECHWISGTVCTMLKNEKYIGDQLFQKQYTTNVLPYKRVYNRGEHTKYYYSQRHKPIITKEVFYKVRKILNEQKKAHKGFQHNIFSKKIYCGECGTIYKLKKSKTEACWVCRNHDYDSASCSMKRVSERNIKSAFVKLHNKLLYNYRQILTPLAVNLERVNLKSLSNNKDLLEIHKQIAKLKEQTHVLARLKTKGFLDEAKYLGQTTELNSKIAKLQTEIKKLNVSDEEDETLEQLDMLIGYFEKRQKLMVEFEELAFESIVDKIVVKNQNELEFHLIGGLELTEKICS